MAPREEIWIDLSVSLFDGKWVVFIENCEITCRSLEDVLDTLRAGASAELTSRLQKLGKPVANAVPA